MKKHVFMITVPAELHKKVKQSALHKEITMTTWIIKAIENEFKRIEK